MVETRLPPRPAGVRRFMRLRILLARLDICPPCIGARRAGRLETAARLRPALHLDATDPAKKEPRHKGRGHRRVGPTSLRSKDAAVLMRKFAGSVLRCRANLLLIFANLRNGPGISHQGILLWLSQFNGASEAQR